MSLTLAEARQRAACVSEVEYDVDLDVTRTDSFLSRTTVRFGSSGEDTFLELAHADELRVTVDGAVRDTGYDGARIPLTGLAVGPVEVAVEARLPYVTDGDGMHTFTDPADGERYVSAYTGMNIAHRVIACFDQVDLKAVLTLSVTADPAWTVVGNGEIASFAGGVTTFAPTALMPITLLVMCAGPWVSQRWQHAGTSFAWHARRSLAAELERDIGELRSTTNACFDHYASIFEEPYAFGAYDQVFAPGLNWGAMENPGCVTFRDEYLPRGRLTDTLREHRAMVVAHEMAHMWFGDLVTMSWWEDTWLQESFADYMGFRVSEAIGFSATRVAFEVGQKPWAYVADERRSTHPVAPRTEDVPDVDSAFANFDAISYAKGNAVLRQLVVWLGDEAFLAGVNAYLTRHRFGNATLSDFVAALDAATDRDVRAWVEVWLRQPGFDTLRATPDGLVREGVRPHRFTITTYDASLAALASQVVDLGDESIPLPDGVVLPDSGGDTYARVRPDATSWAALKDGLSALADERTRAVLWTIAFDLVHTREQSPADHLDLVASQLPGESSATIVEQVLRHLGRTVLTTRVTCADAPAALDAVAALCRVGLDARPAEQAALAFTQGLAWSSRDAGLLASWLEADRTDLGLELDPELRWTVVHRLAEIGADVDVEAESARDPAGAPEGAATARAARPTAGAKADAWASMTDPTVSNRLFSAHAAGLWSPTQAGLVAPYVSSYLAAMPDLARARGQAFSQVIGHAFPALTLTEPQIGELRVALDGDVPTVLRRFWEDRLDDLA